MLDRILVIDDEPVVLDFLSDVLTREGFSVRVASHAAEGLETLAGEPQDLVLCDIRMPGMDGFELLRSVLRRHPGTDVILMTGYASVDGAIDAMTLGAADYLIKPLKPKEIVARIRSCLERRRLQSQVAELKGALRSRYDRHRIVADSPRMMSVAAALPRVAATEAPVLLHGRPGSGRRFLARAIHHASPRCEERLAEVECERIPSAKEAVGLIFGAIQAGSRRVPGQLERVGRGTLLLADVDQLPLEVQAVLGRCLSEGAWRRDGETSGQPLEGRLVLTSEAPPADLAAKGRLAPELAQLPDLVLLHVPPLEERTEDLPGLVRAFMEEHAVEHGRVLQVPSELVDLLAGRRLEANVRQLFVALGHAATLSSDGVLTRELLELALERASSEDGAAGRISDKLDQREYQLVLSAVQRYPRRLDEAARELGVSRTTLWRRMRKYDIRVPHGSSRRSPKRES